MFKAKDKNAILEIPHFLDQFSENFISHMGFGEKFGKNAFQWENFVRTFGVCECTMLLRANGVWTQCYCYFLVAPG
jgi:hypothetical protein